MKFFLVLFNLISVTAFSQDKIITLQNDTIDCNIIRGTDTYFRIERNGAKSKMPFDQVKAYRFKDQWYENEALNESEDTSMMLREPENMRVLIDSDDTDPQLKVALLLEQGGSQIATGTVVGLISAVLGIALASGSPTLAAIVGGGGFLAGTIITISGASKVSRAGFELQKAKFE